MSSALRYTGDRSPTAISLSASRSPACHHVQCLADFGRTGELAAAADPGSGDGGLSSHGAPTSSMLGLPGQDRTGPDGRAPVRGALTGGKAPGARRRSGHRERVAREHRPGRQLGSVFSRVRVGAAAAPATVSGAVCAGSNPAGGAGRDIVFEYILVGPCPDGQLGRDSMNRPSTRHFMTHCHSTRPPNRLHANLFARDLRERIPSHEGVAGRPS